MLLVRNIYRVWFVLINLMDLHFRCDTVSDYMFCVEVVTFSVLAFFVGFRNYDICFVLPYIEF